MIRRMGLWRLMPVPHSTPITRTLPERQTIRGPPESPLRAWPDISSHLPPWKLSGVLTPTWKRSDPSEPNPAA